MRISRERWAFSVRSAATAGSEEPEGAGQAVDGSAFDAELGEELLGAGVAGAVGGDQGLLHGQGEATAQGLGEQLEAGLGDDLGVGDGADEPRRGGLELAELGHPGARAESLGTGLAQGAAEVEHDVDLVALLRGEAGAGTCVGQLVGGGLELLDGVREGSLVARGPRLRGDHGALGDREVGDRGTQHRDLVAGRRRVRRLGEVAAHAQAAEGRRQQQRDGQGKGELAAQRPTGDLERRSTSGAGGGGRGAHGSPVSSSQTLPSRRPTDWKGVIVNVGTGRHGHARFPDNRSARRAISPHLV